MDDSIGGINMNEHVTSMRVGDIEPAKPNRDYAPERIPDDAYAEHNRSEPPKVVLNPSYINNGGRGSYKIIDMKDHRCDALAGSPERGLWQWRCPKCGRRWEGSTGFATSTSGTSLRWKLSEWRRRREINRRRDHA